MRLNWKLCSEDCTSKECLFKVVRPFLFAIFGIRLRLTSAILGITLRVVEPSQEDPGSLVFLGLSRVVRATVSRTGETAAERGVRDRMLMTVYVLSLEGQTSVSILG